MPRVDTKPHYFPLPLGWFVPFLMLVPMFFCYVYTLMDELFVRANVSILYDFPTLQSKAFAVFWKAFFTRRMEPPAAFLQLLNSLHGSVCELGPGSGAQIEFFGPRADIDVVYGIEPNADLHAKLRELAARAAFAPDQYRIVGCGAEPESLVPALARLGLLPTTGGAGGAGAGGAADGVFDDILCIKVLCGVPRLPETVEGLYRLLRPGGRLIVQEHVVNKCAAPTGSYVARAAQALAMALGWRLWMAGCELDRDTEAVLRQAARAHGGWQAVVLDTINSNTALPMIQGYLQKRA